MSDGFSSETIEGVVIDGANSVTGAARRGFPGGTAELLAFAVVVIVTAAVGKTRFRRPALAAMLLGASVSGWLAMQRRADAPHRRPVVAAVVKTGLDDLMAQGPAGAVSVVRDDGEVLFPLGRYAWPTRPDVDGGVHVELRGSLLVTGCHFDLPTGRRVCGVGP